MKVRPGLYPTGRKFCSGCRCWRYLYEFGPATQSRSPGVLRSSCGTCERLRSRYRIGMKNRGRPYAQAQPYGPTPQDYCQKGHRMEGENVMDSGGHRRCRTCYRAWATSPQRREYQRIWDHDKRRRSGVKATNHKRTTPQGKDERMRIDVEPFRDWLRELLKDANVGEVALRTGIHDRQIQAYVHTEYETVHIDVVDRAIINEGSMFLWDLYPDLYADEAVAA